MKEYTSLKWSSNPNSSNLLQNYVSTQTENFQNQMQILWYAIIKCDLHVTCVSKHDYRIAKGNSQTTHIEIDTWKEKLNGTSITTWKSLSRRPSKINYLSTGSRQNQSIWNAQFQLVLHSIKITNSMGKVHTLKEVDMIIQIFASKMWIFHIVRLYLNWNFFQSDIRIFVYQSWRSKALWCEVRELKIAVCNLYSRLLCLWEFDENLNSSFLWCVEKCVDL